MDVKYASNAGAFTCLPRGEKEQHRHPPDLTKKPTLVNARWYKLPHTAGCVPGNLQDH